MTMPTARQRKTENLLALPDRFVVDERYADTAAVDTHRATPHFQHYASKVNTLAEHVTYVVAPFDIGCKPKGMRQWQ